jgi:hypothetical protein
MAYGVLITLTDLGGLVGPFDLYSNLDGYTTPFETNIPVSAFTYGYYTTLLPYGTTIIKVKSDGECINFINLDIVGLPTFTPTTTNTPSPTRTPNVTPSVTPSITASNTMTPTQTSTVPVTPTQTQTSTPTKTLTPTPSETLAAGQLLIYAKYRNQEAYLQYQVNYGGTIGVGNIDALSCDYYTTITGLSNGDVLYFDTIGGYILAQDNSNCPNSGFACSQVYNYVGSGIQSLYITVDGSTGC